MQRLLLDMFSMFERHVRATTPTGNPLDIRVQTAIDRALLILGSEWISEPRHLVDNDLIEGGWFEVYLFTLNFLQ